jgi:hypothetical protein
VVLSVFDCIHEKVQTTNKALGLGMMTSSTSIAIGGKSSSLQLGILKND